jgi:hypothetical protein
MTSYQPSAVSYQRLAAGTHSGRAYVRARLEQTLGSARTDG